MRRAGVVLGVLVGLFLVADFGLRIAAENSASKLIDRKIAHDVDPEVGLGKFPFLRSLIAGRFDHVTIDIPEASEGSLVVEDIHLRLKDVQLEALEVLGGRGNLRAASLSGRAVVSEETLSGLISDRASGIGVNIQDGRISLSRDGVEVPANAVIAVNRILIGAGEVMAPIEIQLPSLFGGVKFSTLRAERGRLVLGVTGSELRIRA